jgi:carboxyl-terminal processing protease
VVPDIRFPSAGDPQDYGERSLDNALPWTSIDSARYDPSGDLSRLVAVADNRYHGRMAGNEEFAWLLSDISEFNEHAEEKSVSLLESVGRQELKEAEEKQAQRKAQRESGGPLLAADDILADSIDPETGEYPDTEEADAAGDDEDEGPDLLLREAARIVADMVLLESDIELLDRQFAQIVANKAHEDPKLN